MKTKFDFTGQRHFRWTVLRRTGSKKIGVTPFSLWLCRCDCGTERVVLGNSLRQGTTRSCGCLMREKNSRFGEQSPHWKGGRRITSQGYVRLTNAQYPGSKQRNLTPEHVVVMSRFLGRPLHPAETVHHKNGVRDDNRIENLELWRSSHPAGQRVEDLIVWAKQILADYPSESFSDKLSGINNKTKTKRKT